MAELRRDVPLPPLDADVDDLLEYEWIVTNGLSGFASSTVAGVPTRRYHGMLIAALPAPHGRVVMLTDLAAEVRMPDGSCLPLSGEDRPGLAHEVPGMSQLRAFWLESGLPVWQYQVGSATIERRIVMVHNQNTVHIGYRLIEGTERVWLRLRPAIHFRALEAVVSEPLGGPYAITTIEDRHEIALDGSPLPPLRMRLRGDRSTFTVATERLAGVYYLTEDQRGYDAVGDLWSPGQFGADLSPESPTISLVASTETWERINALDFDTAQDAEKRRRARLLTQAQRTIHDDFAGELVLAADQFVIAPAGRVGDSARASAAGDELRSVIAGYHWFTDWGRDTMISLEGLTITTGRHDEAGFILRTFAQYVRDGLIPNMFPEGQHEGLYHTADASLWFFHALNRYLAATRDQATLRLILPKLRSIVEHHVAGTLFGIGVDPTDGLLHQGAEGYQLTWMDAKVDGWVVTPRRGKAVEINALWYNALRLLEGWEDAVGDAGRAKQLGELAQRASQSFGARFWYPEGGHLYDIVDGERGDDPACRPNQLLAVSLDHPVLARERWEAVVETVRQRLVTPLGLRSLAPGDPDYKPVYFGDLRARDAAYHQGTVWAWPIGPFVDAWLKVHPEDRVGARRFLEGFPPHLAEAGIGTISEIFDAEPPFTPRGCISQAWSVAEVLRSWVRTEPVG